MASILYAWEFGANLGHIGTFLPVARELDRRGHTVHWIVTHPHQAAKLLPQAGFSWLQAPTIPEQRREGPPLNYADILLRFGYANANDLLGLTVAWRELIKLTGAQLVLADHSPTAILAARTLGVPVMLFGSGFYAPPLVSPTPNMRPWVPIPGERLVEIDRLAVSAINQVLAHFDQAPIQHVAELFLVAEQALLTFPELDHYPHRGDAKYWGILPSAVANAPEWDEHPGAKVFAYLRPEGANFGAMLQTLLQSNLNALVFAPGFSIEAQQPYLRHGLRFSSVPVDLNLVGRQCAVGITYASLTTTLAFMMAGTPLLLVPGHLEQFLMAKRVEEMGAGLIVNPETPNPILPPLLEQLLGNPAFRHNAQAFAKKYARFDQNEVMTNIVRRIEVLAHAQ